MMRPSSELTEVFLCLDPVDFRKGINGLAALVETVLERDPFSSGLFVFRNRQRDKVKILYWERNGFCLWQKRLEEERFHWLERSGERVAGISFQQLNWLLEGYDIARMKPRKMLKYSGVSWHFHGVDAMIRHHERYHFRPVDRPSPGSRHPPVVGSATAAREGDSDRSGALSAGADQHSPGQAVWPLQREGGSHAGSSRLAGVV